MSRDLIRLTFHGRVEDESPSPWWWVTGAHQGTILKIVTRRECCSWSDTPEGGIRKSWIPLMMRLTFSSCDAKIMYKQVRGLKKADPSKLQHQRQLLQQSRFFEGEDRRALLSKTADAGQELSGIRDNL